MTTKTARDFENEYNERVAEDQKKSTEKFLASREIAKLAMKELNAWMDYAVDPENANWTEESTMIEVESKLCDLTQLIEENFS